MFSKFVGKVLFFWSPIDNEVLLEHMILHPVKLHVHRFWFSLLNIPVCGAGSVRTICLDWSSQLQVAHFGECDSEYDAIFCIVEYSAGFIFGGGWHHIAHNITNGMYFAIRSGRGNGSLGGISGAGSECEEATDYAVWFRFWSIGGIAIYVQYHIAGNITKGRIGMCGFIV